MALVLLSAIGCRELVQPQAYQPPVLPVSGTILTVDGRNANGASVRLNNRRFVSYPDGRSWFGETDASGRFTTDLPSPGIYDVEVDYSISWPLRRWTFSAVQFGSSELVLRPQPVFQPAHLILPPELEARFQFGDGSVRYRLYSQISGSTEVATLQFAVFASHDFTMALPWYGRFNMRLSLGMEGPDIYVTLGDSVLASGADTLQVAPPLIAFEVLPTLRGSPLLTSLNSIRAVTERFDGSSAEMQASAVSGQPLRVWGVAGLAEISVSSASSATFFPGRVYASVEAGSVVPCELGRYIATIRLVTPEGESAPAIPLEIWRYSPGDVLALESDPSGAASFYCNGGAYLIDINRDERMRTGAEIHSDTTLTFTVLPAAR